jgi:hypothetical protein
MNKRGFQFSEEPPNLEQDKAKIGNRKPTLTLLGESDKVAYRLGKQ